MVTLASRRVSSGVLSSGPYESEYRQHTNENQRGGHPASSGTIDGCSLKAHEPSPSGGDRCDADSFQDAARRGRYRVGGGACQSAPVRESRRDVPCLLAQSSTSLTRRRRRLFASRDAEPQIRAQPVGSPLIASSLQGARSTPGLARIRNTGSLLASRGGVRMRVLAAWDPGRIADRDGSRPRTCDHDDQ